METEVVGMFRVSRLLRSAGFVTVVALAVTLSGAQPAAARIGVRWHRSAGVVLRSVATDPSGITVVVGSAHGKLGAGRVLVRAFAAGGTRLWRNSWRPTPDSTTHGSDADIGPGGRVLAAGAVWTPMDIDAPTTWFLRAYSPRGKVLWTRFAPGWHMGSRSTSADGVATWPNGVVLASSVCGEGGCYGGFVRSYTPDGSLRWIRSVGGTYGSAEDVSVTYTGVVYVTGTFKALGSPPGEDDHPFVTKLGPNGTKAWTHRFAVPDGRGTAIDVRRGRVVVASVSSSGRSTRLVSLRADGTERWRRSWRYRTIADLDVTRSGKIWVTGAHRTGSHSSLFVRAYRAGGALKAAWFRHPADIETWGTGVAAGPAGVSVAGSWGGQGRVWRLRTRG